MVRDLEKQLLERVPRRGMSRDFVDRLLPRIAQAYVQGKTPEIAAASTHISRGEVESVFHKFRQYYDVSAELTASSVVLNAYRELGDKNPHKDLMMPDNICLLVERPKGGRGFFMDYREFGVFDFGLGQRAVALGNGIGGYLGVYGYGDHQSPYERDIFVLRGTTGEDFSLQRQVASAVHSANGFSNSLVAARKDIGLVFPGLADGGRMREIAGGRVASLTLGGKRGVLYRKDLVPVLVDAIEKVLGK